MKTILITGVAGGMGKTVAKTFYENGFVVYGIDRLNQIDLPINYYKVDLRNKNEIENVFNEISKKEKKFDIIYHFAGYYTMNSLVEIEDEEFLKIFEINMFSIYRVNKIFMPLLKKHSKIVMTSSELAPLNPLPFTGLYAITKSTIEKYAFSLKMELNLLGIDVILIRPGAVNTSMINASQIALEKLCQETKLYKYNTSKFQKIVNSVETKNISPERIAKIALKIANKKKVKYIYNINRNIWLRLLSILPKKVQIKIIALILKEK